MDEKKRIIDFDAAEEVPADGQIPIDSASKGTKKITPALLLKAITDLLGDEALETLAQTLTGAVNEVKGIADDAQDLAENISDEYSSSSAYAKGDYCIHNNTLYKCTTAIGSGGEAWNASHWSATKCDDELSELKGTLTYSKLFTSNHIILETNGGCVHLFTISIEPYSNIYNTVIIGNTYADYRPKYDIMQPAIIRHNGTYEACMARLTTDGKIVCSDSGGNTITNTTNFDYIVFSFAYAKK